MFEFAFSFVDTKLNTKFFNNLEKDKTCELCQSYNTVTSEVCIRDKIHMLGDFNQSGHGKII